MEVGQQVPEITLVLVALVLASVGYNWLMDTLYGRLGTTPLASLWVAGGVAYTVAAGGIIAWLLSDWQMMSYYIAINAVTFTAAGMPMILGNVNRDTRRDH